MIKDIVKRNKITYYETKYIEINNIWNIYMDLLISMNENKRIVKEEQEKIKKVERIIDKLDYNKKKLLDKIYKNI